MNAMATTAIVLIAVAYAAPRLVDLVLTWRAYRRHLYRYPFTRQSRLEVWRHYTRKPR